LDDDDDDKVGRRDLQVVFPRHQKARTGAPGFGMFLRSQGKVLARIDSPQGLAVSLVAAVGRCIETRRECWVGGCCESARRPETTVQLPHPGRHVRGGEGVGYFRREQTM
jgi:hypothetical protein